MVGEEGVFLFINTEMEKKKHVLFIFAVIILELPVAHHSCLSSRKQEKMQQTPQQNQNKICKLF